MYRDAWDVDPFEECEHDDIRAAYDVMVKQREKLMRARTVYTCGKHKYNLSKAGIRAFAEYLRTLNSGGSYRRGTLGMIYALYDSGSISENAVRSAIKYLYDAAVFEPILMLYDAEGIDADFICKIIAQLTKAGYDFLSGEEVRKQ